MHSSTHDTAIIHAGIAWPVRGSATATIARVERITALLDAASKTLDLAAEQQSAHPLTHGVLDATSRLVFGLSLLPVRIVGRLGSVTMTIAAAEYLTVEDRDTAVAAHARDSGALVDMTSECERRAQRDRFFEWIRARDGERAERRAWERYMAAQLEDYDLLLQHTVWRPDGPPTPEGPLTGT